MTDHELFRLLLDDYKEFASNVVFKDALDLAKQYFVNNPNTHNNWDILDESIKQMNVKFAEGAIQEITYQKSPQYRLTRAPNQYRV